MFLCYSSNLHSLATSSNSSPDQISHIFQSFTHVLNRAEVRGGGRKPWQQKGLGKARHGSIRSPLWINGGIAHGPRAPTSYFYMLPIHTRLYGLRSMLSVKLAQVSFHILVICYCDFSLSVDNILFQDDLHIVNALDLPTNEPSYLEELAEERQWGPSILFVDE